MSFVCTRMDSIGSTLFALGVQPLKPSTSRNTPLSEALPQTAFQLVVRLRQTRKHCVHVSGFQQVKWKSNDVVANCHWTPP